VGRWDDGGHPGSEETVIMHKSTRGIRNELHSKRNELFADSQPWRKSSQSFWQPKMSPTCQAAESFGPAHKQPPAQVLYARFDALFGLVSL